MIFGEVGKVYAVKWKDVLDSIWHLVDKDENYHNIVYNQDLNQPVIVAGWITLRNFYQLTGNHLVSLHHYVLGSVTFKVYLTEQKVSCSSLDVPSVMHYFLKDKGWTHLHLEDVAECRLVFNHWRKTLKIEAGWKHFYKTLSFTTDMKIVFEFIDPDVNCVLYWSCV
uniref:TF-B3 domain-containing protein n=1 Tax=Glycine max TaxID=3847 RepID=A0A0R0FC93_SOYBN